jgi:hypothetical protein
VITDKTCFIHLRNYDEYGNFRVKGGATIAWIVDEETGDIVIGQPARCMEVDTFKKETGRNLAWSNLTYERAAFRIARASLVFLAQAQARSALRFSVLTPNAIAGLNDYIATEIQLNVEQTMSSNWYEQIVRAHFVLHPNNRLEQAVEALNPLNVLLSV